MMLWMEIKIPRSAYPTVYTYSSMIVSNDILFPMYIVNKSVLRRLISITIVRKKIQLPRIDHSDGIYCVQQPLAVCCELRK
jgi:hypothetical protein